MIYWFTCILVSLPRLLFRKIVEFNLFFPLFFKEFKFGLIEKTRSIEQNGQRDEGENNIVKALVFEYGTRTIVIFKNYFE